MKYITPFILFWILFGFKSTHAEEECFLFINGEKKGQEFTIVQLVRPVLPSHIQSNKSVPPEGITSKQLESECKFELSLVYTEETLKISLDSKRTKTPINGYASSTKEFPDNIREAFLTVLVPYVSETSKVKI